MSTSAKWTALPGLLDEMNQLRLQLLAANSAATGCVTAGSGHAVVPSETAATRR